MDISADLTELGRTPVAVVCAGAKSVSRRQVLLMWVPGGMLWQMLVCWEASGSRPRAQFMLLAAIAVVVV
jgi:hypothetical protein